VRSQLAGESQGILLKHPKLLWWSSAPPSQRNKCPDKFVENNIVYGRLYRCAERWQERPVILLLDGYPHVGYHTAFPLLARRFNRAGFNVATLVGSLQSSTPSAPTNGRELSGVCAVHGTERGRDSRGDWLAAW